MPSGNPGGYKTGRDHPAAGRAPSGGGSGRTPYGRDVIKQSVPRGTKPAEQPRNPNGTYAEKEAERERVKAAINRAHRRGEFYADQTTTSDV